MPPVNPLQPTGVPGGMIVGAPDPMGATAPPPSASRGRLKPLLIGLAAVLIIGGGSAAAYFGAVVPNEPANVLKSALINTLLQTQSSATGTVDDSSQGIKVGFTTAENATAKAADVQLNITASGLTFPIEGRLVNHNIYVKVGDLSSIASMLNAYSPQAGSLAQAVSGQLSNQWIVFDSTLIDQSQSLNCVLNTSWTFTNADLNLLEQQYNTNPFTTIQSTAGATVDGVAAEKFNLSVDNQTLDKFINGLNSLSVVKNLSKCAGGTSATTGSYTGDTGHTNLAVWVDKSTKRIVQIDNTTSGITTDVTLSYKPVNVTAPTGAKPALQVLSQLQSTLSSSGIDFSQLFGGSGSTGTSATTL